MTRARLPQPIVWALVACALALAAPAVAQAATPNAQLLRTYQPVTRFDPAERFRPTSIQSFSRTPISSASTARGGWSSTPTPSRAR